ncbi:MAG: hypothetical protein HOO06_07065 [Bdellovibrionaceae bacterium]|jgi:hypothetical protein|nr:hypothetical protein [Pseudobdellovibrionaceae bacterium]
MRGIVVLLAICVLPTKVVADYYNSRLQHGVDKNVFSSPDGYQEECVVPEHFPEVEYKSSDAKNETQLCMIDFYAATEQAPIGICPKLRSTNPGLEIYKLQSNETKKDFEKNYCSMKKIPRKKLAKYKQSITCSYTPSILSYYHLSRIFNGAGRVPVSVIRTMGIDGHMNYVDVGIQVSEKLKGKKAVVTRAWKAWKKAHAKPGSPARGGFKIHPERVYTEDRSGIYGALSDNVRNEAKYVEMFGRYKYATRYESFQKQKVFKLAINSKTIHQILPKSFSGSAQRVQQMKDVTDMIVLDTLLSQADRVGNIHYKKYWQYIEDGKLKSKKFKLMDTGEIENRDVMLDRKAVIVKEMIIRDNDCGVIKENMSEKHNLVSKIRHMHPNTYTTLVWLNDQLQRPEVKEYILKEWLFSKYDYRKLIRSSKKMVQTLTTNYNQGKLHLDLDIVKFLGCDGGSECHIE